MDNALPITYYTFFLQKMDQRGGKHEWSHCMLVFKSVQVINKKNTVHLEGEKKKEQADDTSY